MRRPFFALLVLILAACGGGGRRLSPAPRPDARKLPIAISPTAISLEARLRKLSFQLRGVSPSANDYRALRVASGNGSEGDFFAGKAREYIGSPAYIAKMIERLDELFRLKAASALPESWLVSPPKLEERFPGIEAFNAMDFLFEDLARKNLSWDSLLLAHKYRVPAAGFGLESFGGTNDLSFLQPVVPGLDAGARGRLVPVSFKEADPRVAGAITTARFFGRYSTTNLNRSRGRAAAIFRIFLCDDMRAVVVSKDADDDEELLRKAFPRKRPPADGFHSEAALRAFAASGANGRRDKHGTLASCMACHYKLDPMGRTFFTIGSTFSDEASPGALVYKRAAGSSVNVPVRGLGDLARAIVRQPEYASCQVSHFWRWFIRSDEMPSEKRLTELVAEFNRLGRRTNDFVAYLVGQREFYDPLSRGSELTLRHVRPVLQRCTQCHSGLRAPIPGFDHFPVGEVSTHEGWLRRIAERLDLAHGGAARTMPPRESAWQPSREDLKRLKVWIAQGARDEEGNPTLDSRAAGELLGADRGVLDAPAPKVTFKRTFRRYVSGHDLFRLLSQKFPKGAPSNSECTELTDGNRALLGEESPAIGQPVYYEPSSAFIRWYVKCLLPRIDKDVSASDPKGMTRYLGSASARVPDAKAMKWGRLSQETRLGILRHLVDEWIGPRAVAHEDRFISRVDESLRKKFGGVSVYDALRRALFIVATQEEFLSY